MASLNASEFCRRAARACLIEAKRSPPRLRADLIRIAERWLQTGRQSYLAANQRPIRDHEDLGMNESASARPRHLGR